MSHVHLAEYPAWIVRLSFRTELMNFAVLLLGQEVSRCYWLSEVTVVESDWPAPSVQHRQFVQPSSRPFLSRNSMVQSFSPFLPLSSLQKHRPLDYLRKKICNVYLSADQECHSSNRSPCSQLPLLLQDEWMEASAINMATRPIKNLHDWKMASAKNLHLFETSFLYFYVLRWQTGFRDRFCPVGNSRSKVEMLSRGFDYKCFAQARLCSVCVYVCVYTHTQTHIKYKANHMGGLARFKSLYWRGLEYASARVAASQIFSSLPCWKVLFFPPSN